MLEDFSKESIAHFFGYLSIACWIIVLTPQFKENYTQKDTGGVSMSFLVCWLLGDVLNLFGIILDNLLFTMLLLAVYYLFSDIVLMAQVLYYRKFYKAKHHDEIVDYAPANNDVRHSFDTTSSRDSNISGLSNHASQSRQFLDENSPLLAQIKSGYSYTHHHKKTTLQTRRVVRIFTLLSILMWVAMLVGSAYFFFWSDREIDLTHWHLVPQLLGWGSAILYCTSRIPQIMQNFRNESVEGLSLTMFVFSVVGNITYCLSIILFSLDPTFLLVNYPWLLGSGGTLFFDFTIFFQFYMYHKRTDSNLKNIP
ncbi:PQ-loop-domain-containing protein [Backusella circina FSU 941]|nr:PQ-loop-domain-containing protein [Backusella circina FSU 941]